MILFRIYLLKIKEQSRMVISNESFDKAPLSAVPFSFPNNPHPSSSFDATPERVIST